jgi:hypothetical protein
MDCESERTEKKVSVVCFKALTEHSHGSDRNHKNPQPEQPVPSQDLNFVSSEHKSEVLPFI